MIRPDDDIYFCNIIILVLIIMQNQSANFFNVSLSSTIVKTKESLWQMKRWVLPEITSYLSMWYQIFLWLLIFNVLVHSIAAVVAFYRLRSHKIARFYGLMVLALGFLGPITIGAISTAVIAWIYYNSTWQMPAFYAMLAGLLQCILLLIVSFTQVLATL